MRKAILIIGDDETLEMKVLEAQLGSRLKRRMYPVEGEYFWPGIRGSEVLSFQQRGHTRRVAAAEILYLEKDMRRIHLHLEQGITLSFYGNMEDSLKQLGSGFIHCHKSYIVNMDKVTKMGENSFLLKDGTEVPIGQRRRCVVSERFEQYQDQKNIEKLRFFENFSCFEI